VIPFMGPTLGRRAIGACACIVGSLLLLGAAETATAAPAIEIHQDVEGEIGPLLGKISKGECFRKKTGAFAFSAFGPSTNKSYELVVRIPSRDWRGFGHHYSLFYGSHDPAFFGLTGPRHELFSNTFPLPGTPPGVVGGGAIVFKGKGSLMSIGFEPAFNEAADEAVFIFGGFLKCAGPRTK